MCAQSSIHVLQGALLKADFSAVSRHVQVDTHSRLQGAEYAALKMPAPYTS